MEEGSKKDSEEHVEQGEGEAGERKRKRKWVEAGVIPWEGGLLDPRQEAIGIHEMPGR